MLLRLLIFALFLTMTVCSQTPAIETGVPQTLARWRAANYSDVRYKLNLTLEKMSPTLKGTIEISLRNDADQIILDWRKIRGKEDLSKISNVFLNDKPAKFEEINEHLVFKDAVIKGENVVKLDFTSPIATSGAAITRYVDKEDGAEYVYSLFVPSDASTAFPVFDQPDLKARFQLDIFSPIDWQVISNGDAFVFDKSQDLLGKVIIVPNDKILNRFIETKPISTYVFAFAAGQFSRIEEQHKPIDLGTLSLERDYSRIYVRKSQAEKFKAHEKEVFRLNREGIKFLENYFDYKFPFPKYDLVLIPEFPFGGMEHAGATFLREDRVIFPSEPTKNDYITRANVIFHEAAHQWFGDTVTMRWFDDLWLKEGFAEFMAYKTLEKVMPEYNAWKAFYERNKQAAYLTDSTKGTTPIYQEISNLSAAKSAYGNIVYRKAPSFLRQAEFYLGEDKFQTAVRAFLKKHEFKNAEWTDLVKEFETASKQDLQDWANVWVKQRGLPILNLGIKNVHVGNPWRDAFVDYSLDQEDVLKEKGLWQMKTNVLMRFGEKTDVQAVTISRNENPIGKFWTCCAKEPQTNEKTPDFIFPNYQDYGYGIFLLDEQSRDYVLKNIQNEKDDFLRTMMWGSLWDSVRETELAPKDYVELVIKNFSTPNEKVLSSDFSRQLSKQKPTKVGTQNAGTQNIIETDESTIQTLLNRVSTAMSYYLSDKQRAEVAPRLEAVLVDKIANAKTQGQRITFYRAYLNLASSANAAQVLKDIFAGKSKIAVFGLKTKDKFDIVARLLILGDREAPNLLANLEKTETSDEAKRYAYAARAGVGSAAAKAKYFNDFLKSAQLSESWIEAAFGPFNSVRHSDLTLLYLETALAELPNLKRNRKIFFVNGWLGAFIGGQKSEQALAIVNKFLADNPNLDKDLRLKILENADGLERAVKIRGKFGQ